MKRRLATLMTVAMLALAVGAAPTLADGRADGPGGHWVVVARTTTDLTGYGDLGGMLDCGASTYTIVSGFVDQVEMYRGKLDPLGVAEGPGQGAETWTLRDVKVQNEKTLRIYHAIGSSRLDVTWNKGATYGQGPFTSGSFVQNVWVMGTRDGRSFTQVLSRKSQLLVMKSDHGTCSNLQLGLN